MRFTLYCISLIILSLICMRCDTCPDDTCRGDMAFVELRFMSEGENIIGGNSAKVKMRDVSIVQDDTVSVPVNRSTPILTTYLEGNVTYKVILGTYDTIQIKGELDFWYSAECCDLFEFVSFEVDGEEICNTRCSDLTIEVE